MLQNIVSNYSYSQQKSLKDNSFVKQAYQTMLTLSQKAFICYFWSSSFNLGKSDRRKGTQSKGKAKERGK